MGPHGPKLALNKVLTLLSSPLLQVKALFRKVGHALPGMDSAMADGGREQSKFCQLDLQVGCKVALQGDNQTNFYFVTSDQSWS